LQEGFLAFGGERGGEGVLRVAGEVENFHAGAGGQKFLDKFVAAEARHDDVGDDEMNLLGVAGCERQSGVAVVGFENAIAAGLKSFAN